ncbi:MAG: DNA mismatch repair endonuclease MutL [Phycisphaerales bacterium]|nr:MAG: DNA mismatch repair endonuclease MutL [Phycisphaerales bacterium]
MNPKRDIRVLPDQLVNKIAAGEVIERPASVVKELVENSIDAGARRIAITIERGGKELIRVVDDGCGMSPENLGLAAVPHATSKLIEEDDLYSILTMGFRGEALASISSVAKLRIVSRPAEVDEGQEISVVAKQVELAQAAGCPVGTTVEVRDLFFNVPARRRFLRADSTESGHVNEQITRVALAHPEIAFELTHNNRLILSLPAVETRLERIAKCYGTELASDLICISRDERGVLIEAYAAPPAHSRSNAQWQYVYVNGRYVRDRFIQHAIKEAYRGLVEQNRYGVAFLFIELDPRMVDVNVHPTKIEVRWADSNLIHSQVLSALRETFQRCDLTPALRTDRVREPIRPEEQDRIRSEVAAQLKAMQPIGPAGQASPGQGRIPSIPAFPVSRYGAPTAAAVSFSPRPARSPEEATESWRSLYGAPDSGSPLSPTTDALAQPKAGEADRRARVIQMHNLYLVAETEDGIVIIDQHALHERIMYEELRQRITSGPLESQRLLLPETVRVTPQQAALLEEHIDLLARLGVEATPFGSDTIAVHAFPSLLKDTDVPSFMRDLLDHLSQQEAGTSTEVVIHELLDMMACKAAIKAGDPLTDKEIQTLISRKELVEKSSSCPHGRPTMLRLTKTDLERQFKRT